MEILLFRNSMAQKDRQTLGGGLLEDSYLRTNIVMFQSSLKHKGQSTSYIFSFYF